MFVKVTDFAGVKRGQCEKYRGNKRLGESQVRNDLEKTDVEQQTNYVPVTELTD